MKRFFFFILLFIIHTASFAQQQYTFTNYTQEQGISSGSIRGMFKDTTGYLWLYSEEGVSRFDGYSFKTFRHNPDDSTSLADNIIWSGNKTVKGDIYFETNSGLQVYDPRTESFSKGFPNGINETPKVSFKLKNDPQAYYLITNYTLIRATKTAYNSYPIPDTKSAPYMYQATDSVNLILVGLGSVAYLFDIAHKKFEKIAILNSEGKPDTTIIDYQYMPDEQTFIAISNSNLYKFDKTTRKFSPYFTLRHLTNIGELIYGFTVSYNKYLLVFASSGVINRVNVNDGSEKIITLNKKIPEDELKDRVFFRGYIDEKGFLWISTRGMGLFRMNPETEEVEQFIHEPGNSNSLVSNASDMVLPDENGVIWVGCFGKGLVKMEPVVAILKSAIPAVNKTKGTSGGFNENIRAFLERENGYWIGTLKGLYSYDKNKNEYTEIGPQFSEKMASDGRIGTFTRDNSGNIWIGTWYGELLIWNEKTGKHISLVMPYPQRDMGYGAGIFRDLYSDRKNSMWIATYGGGTYKINIADLNFENPSAIQISSILFNEKDDASISSNKVFAFTEDADGNIWAGSENGLNRLDAATNKWIRYYNIPGDEKSLHNSNVRSFAFDKKGLLWIGTNGGGLNRYNKAEDNFTHFTMENGLPNDAIYSLLCDNNGMLWLGTNRGLCRFNPGDFTCKNFTEKDGIQNYEYNTGAALKLKNGNLLIGGVAGYNIIDPDKIEDKQSIAPVVVISSFKIFDKEQPLGDKQLELNYRQNSFNFEFSALSYYRNQDNRYAYMMEGVDTNWIYCDTRRYVSYSNLAPGDYTFKVKACNSDGTWNETGAQIAITIKPPWWETVWAKILFGIIIAGAAIGYYRYRTHALRAKQKELIREVEKATVVIRKQKEVVEEEKKRSDELLLNILPAETAEELKRTGSTKAKDFEQVTVLFTDFKNFTLMSEKLSAQELVNEINHCYSAFDNIITKYGIEKIKTIGDAYMCAGGLPVANKTNAFDTVSAAIEMRDFINNEKQKRMENGLPFFEIRIGCHTGPVVAGIVGIKKFAYDIWGDAVNIASRMESSGEPGKVNISGSTYELIKDSFNCIHRGKIEAKNKGTVDMYFVEKLQ